MISLLAAAHPAGPPMKLFYALAPILVLAVAFDVYCLVDLIRSRSVRHLPKAVWALIIVVISAPWGGLIYLFLGRDASGRDASGRDASGRDASGRHGNAEGTTAAR